MGKGEISQPIGGRGELGNFGEGRDFFIAWWKSAEEWFGPFKPVSILKTTFCKYWTSRKRKLARPVCVNSMKLKWKLYRSNDCS